jgi:hypothetical protein
VLEAVIDAVVVGETTGADDESSSTEEPSVSAEVARDEPCLVDPEPDTLPPDGELPSAAPPGEAEVLSVGTADGSERRDGDGASPDGLVFAGSSVAAPGGGCVGPEVAPEAGEWPDSSAAAHSAKHATTIATLVRAVRRGLRDPPMSPPPIAHKQLELNPMVSGDVRPPTNGTVIAHRGTSNNANAQSPCHLRKAVIFVLKG